MLEGPSNLPTAELVTTNTTRQHRHIVWFMHVPGPQRFAHCWDSNQSGLGNSCAGGIGGEQAGGKWSSNSAILCGHCTRGDQEGRLQMTVSCLSTCPEISLESDFVQMLRKAPQMRLQTYILCVCVCVCACLCVCAHSKWDPFSWSPRARLDKTNPNNIATKDRTKATPLLISVSNLFVWY